MPFWFSDVPAMISKNNCHLLGPKPELMWTDVASVASADLCQTTAIANLEADLVGG